MFKMPEKIEYALYENIGNVDLFTGRNEEFDYFFGDWYKTLEKNYAMCTAILSRRKKGKTAILQRMFNILWSAGAEKEEGSLKVIPFYYSIRDKKQSLADFAKEFFVQFSCQYLSYQNRDKALINPSYEFEDLKNLVSKDDALKRLYRSMTIAVKNDNWQRMWDITSETPAFVARRKGVKIIQLVDEFQNINEHITDKRGEILKLSGTYMQVAEMREAPLIVSGSEVHWLLKIVYSLTGRFHTYNLGNLPKKEALEAIEKYAASQETLINSEAREKIWNLTEGDPLYIKALFTSRFNREKDYTVDENIAGVYVEEIKRGEIYGTWMEYMGKIFNTVNKIHSKRIMLYLFKAGKEKTRDEIKKDLNLPYTDEELENKLEALIKGDLISHGISHFDYKITEDKTYELVFRNIYQREIEHFIPDIKKELLRKMGKRNHEEGKYAEFLIKEKIKRSFNLKDLTENGPDMKIVPREIEERKIIKTGVGRNEIDVYIRAQKGYKVYIDVKNTKARYGKRQLERWLRIAEYIRENEKKAIFMVYSENGFTAETVEKLKENEVYVLKK